MESIATSVDRSADPELAADIAALFNLDVRTASLATLPGAADSGDCTNDTCTASCVSCGCK
jgi:hypothetical protein